MEKAEEAALLDVAGVVAGVGGRFYISCRVGWHIGKVRTLPAVDSARLLCGTVIEISIFVLFHTQKLTAKVVPGTLRQVNGMTIAGGGRWVCGTRDADGAGGGLGSGALSVLRGGL